MSATRPSPEATRPYVLGSFVAWISCAILSLAGLLPSLLGTLAWICFVAFILLGAWQLAHTQKALLAFLTRRFLLMIVTLVGITIVTFIIIRAAPGDPVTIETGAGGAGGGGGINPAQFAREAGQTKLNLLNMLHVHRFRATAADPDGDQVQLVFRWGDGSGDHTTEFVAPGAGVEAEHTYSSEGDYAVRVQARDEKGAESPWSEPFTIRIRDTHLPPDAAKIPEGPSELKVGETGTFSSSATHPERSGVTLRFSWGDESATPPSDPVASGATFSREHAWIKAGIYEVRARARGEEGGNGPWSEPLRVVVRDPGNPLVPPTAPEGPSHVRAGVAAAFTAKTGGPGSLEIDWNDGTTSVDEGTHAWTRPGRYLVRAREKDGDTTSDWSAEKTVVVSADNTAPERPAPPEGPATGAIHTSFFYQYAVWLGRLVTLDFGVSVVYNKKVIDLSDAGVDPETGERTDILPERLMRTLFLNITAFVLIYLIAVPIGIFSSTHRDTLRDKSLTVMLFIFYSLPTFWVATMLIVLVTNVTGIPVANLRCSTPDVHPTHLGSHLALTLVIAIASLVACFAFERTRKHPVLYASGAAVAFFITGYLAGIPWGGLLPEKLQDTLWHALLPILCLTYPGLAALSRYARSGMLEVVRQDYIRTARAKGLSEEVVIYKHALRNGMIPILTLMATLLPAMISGSIIIEHIFSIQGMGQLFWEAVTKRDYNVIMAESTLVAVLTLLGILAADILYVLVDPRISFEKLES